MSRSGFTTPLWALLPLTAGCGYGLSDFSDTGIDAKADFEDWAGSASDDDDGSGEDGSTPEDGEGVGEDGGTGDSTDDLPPDDGEDDGEPIEITTISPQHGTNLGGTLVSIKGGPFHSGSVVKIDGSSVPIAANLGDEIRIETQSIEGEGWASLSVTEPDGSSAEVENGFHFWQDGTGLTGATGYYQWVEPVGEYWSSGVPPEGWGGSMVHFIVPTAFHWWNWYTDTMDTCHDSETVSYDGEILVYDLGESAIALKNEIGGHTVLNYDAAALGFSKDELTRSDFKLNQSYELQPFEEPDSPAGSIAGFIETTSSFDVTAPNIDSSIVPYISRSQTVSWSTSGADAVWIEFALLNSTATAIQQSVICIASDDGSFTIPASAWTSWPTDRQVNVTVSKVVESGTVMPHNNSEARVSTFYTIFGAGFSQ